MRSQISIISRCTSLISRDQGFQGPCNTFELGDELPLPGAGVPSPLPFPDPFEFFILFPHLLFLPLVLIHGGL